jgi:hypothetical protein
MVRSGLLRRADVGAKVEESSGINGGFLRNYTEVRSVLSSE